MAKFTDLHAKIQAKLSTGEIVDVYTSIQADGEYKEWIEDMHPDGIGYYESFSEQDIDEDTAELLYPDEWEFADNTKQKFIDDYDGIEIEELLKIIDVDWEIDFNTISDEDC